MYINKCLLIGKAECQKKITCLTRGRLGARGNIESKKVTENKRGEVATGVYSLAGQVAFGLT